MWGALWNSYDEIKSKGTVVASHKTGHDLTAFD